MPTRWNCWKCGLDNSPTSNTCARCESPRENPRAAIELEEKARLNALLVTSTPLLQGCEIEKYFGPVFSLIVLGTGFLSEFSASLADLMGDRATSFEKKLDAARQSAMYDLRFKAHELGANAVIGMDLDYMTLAGNLFVIAASGTAVLVKGPGHSAP